MHIWVKIAFGLLLVCQGVQAQGFLNLNFESTAITNNGPPGQISTSVGLPGWTAYISDRPQSSILYNTTTLGDSSIAIWGNYGGLNGLDGNFSVFLAAGADPNNTALPANSSISQTGVLPVDADSILFVESFFGANLSVTLNGQAIGILPLSTAGNYTVYGGDISAFAGQTVNLTFTALSDWPQSGILGAELDDITFSPSPVPEPSPLGLSAVGGLLFAGRLVRRKPEII